MADLSNGRPFEYAKGGVLQAPHWSHAHCTLHPDECLILLADASEGRTVCRRSGHPTPTSDCA